MIDWLSYLGYGECIEDAQHAGGEVVLGSPPVLRRLVGIGHEYHISEKM
jgi:hypothetical protein